MKLVIAHYLGLIGSKTKK